MSLSRTLLLFGILAIALAADASAQGFVVLHFTSSACRQDAPANAGERTLFRGYRPAGAALLTITGHVAMRFKASTSERQIDSLIAAAGVEVEPAVARGCRRYLLAVADDPITIANALQQSGLVEYAALDLSAGRTEGTPRDSFLVDQAALINSITRTANAVDVAPATYGMGQVLSGYAGPLLRVSGATMGAQLSPPSAASALDLVRSYGITALRLEIPERNALTSVRVVLYSLNGTPVRQLVNEALEAGQYLVGWDGNDDRGRHVQPGVYVAVMTAGSFRETHRLVLR
jgi:hypothetical protein